MISILPAATLFVALSGVLDTPLVEERRVDPTSLDALLAQRSELRQSRPNGIGWYAFVPGVLVHLGAAGGLGLASFGAAWSRESGLSAAYGIGAAVLGIATVSALVYFVWKVFSDRFERERIDEQVHDLDARIAAARTWR